MHPLTVYSETLTLTLTLPLTLTLTLILTRWKLPLRRRAGEWATMELGNSTTSYGDEA